MKNPKPEPGPNYVERLIEWAKQNGELVGSKPDDGNTDTPGTVYECPVCLAGVKLLEALQHCKAHREAGEVTPTLEEWVYGLEYVASRVCGQQLSKSADGSKTANKKRKKPAVTMCPLCNARVRHKKYWNHVNASHSKASKSEKEACRRLATQLNIRKPKRKKRSKRPALPTPTYAKSGMVIKGSSRGRSSDWKTVK